MCIGPDQNLVNQGGGWMQDLHTYWIGYFKNDQGGIPQIYATEFNLRNGEQKTHQITHRTLGFNMLGRGTQTWPISRPVVFKLGATMVVAYREEQRLMASYIVSEGVWKTVELFADNLGNYEPILDYTRLESGVATFYIQSSFQGGRYARNCCRSFFGPSIFTGFD
ncbi:MAG: hypothetical protein IPP19_04905 [Verrucomicrobia bacterium]|nr:hypothetical protein [Verrucomicrobiota bacterium]